MYVHVSVYVLYWQKYNRLKKKKKLKILLPNTTYQPLLYKIMGIGKGNKCFIDIKTITANTQHSYWQPCPNVSTFHLAPPKSNQKVSRSHTQ